MIKKNSLLKTFRPNQNKRYLINKECDNSTKNTEILSIEMGYTISFLTGPHSSQNPRPNTYAKIIVIEKRIKLKTFWKEKA